MDAVAVVSASGKRLMPTNSYRARRLLKSSRARIYKYRPVFTIQLLDRRDGYTQPMEYCCDTGYSHIGISIKSHKHEYVNRQYDLLRDEPERHNDRRKYRSARRNRLRLRKARRNNRILSKFYDARYTDIRDGSVKSGSQLSCGRTNRSESRRSGKNERICRCRKISKGRCSIRRNRYPYRPGDVVWTRKYGKSLVRGTNNRGMTVILMTGKSVQANSIYKTVHCGGWRELKPT